MKWEIGASVRMQQTSSGRGLGLRRGVVVRLTKTLVVVRWEGYPSEERFRRRDGYAPGDRYPSLAQGYRLVVST